MFDRVYPIVPATLPDGRVVWEERGKVGDVQAAIKAYDPRMTLTRDFPGNGWEIVRVEEDGRQSRCARWEGDRCPEPREVLDHLLGHDIWRGYDPLADLDRTEAMIEAAENAQLDEMVGESADRIHYELIDEFSAHFPAARPIGLNPKRGRKRVSA